METLSHIFTNPWGAAFAGWMAFNWLALSLYKDENETTFKLFAYAKEHWDNWFGSLFFIPVLIFIGYKGLAIEIDEKNLQWNDLYYVCSGFFFEALKMAWKKYKASKQVIAK